MVKKAAGIKKRDREKKGNARKLEVPVTDKDKLFCERFLTHADQQRAAKEAGFSLRTGVATKKRRQFAVYLDRMQRQKEVALAKEMVIGQKEILDELVAIGFANPQDYVESYEEQVEGQSVTKFRPKPLMALTRAQAASISQIKFDGQGGLTYKIPSPRVKMPAIVAAGRHFGMFHDKLIQEHRHMHMHQVADLTDVQTQDLLEVEAKLISAMGQEKASQLLGITFEGEFEEVTGA